MLSFNLLVTICILPMLGLANPLNSYSLLERQLVNDPNGNCGPGFPGTTCIGATNGDCCSEFGFW